MEYAVFEASTFCFVDQNMASFERGTVVVLTHNRRVQVLQTLRALSQLPDGWPTIVIDNGSTDGTAKAVAEEFPSVLLIKSRRNLGAAARNIGVAYVHTPYVAFCDDDTQWQPGSLERAAQVLDNNPRVGIVNGCVLVGEAGRVDPTCMKMANSPLDREGLPGPQLLGFMAGACIVRTRAFYEAGGYWPPLFIGGEEELLALDLAVRGWRMVYMEEVVTRHFPSRLRDSPLRERLLFRNAFWVAWMRLPLAQAWLESVELMRRASRRGFLRTVFMPTLAGLPRAFRLRKVVTPRVAAMRAALTAQSVAEATDMAAQTRRRSSLA